MWTEEKDVLLSPPLRGETHGGPRLVSGRANDSAQNRTDQLGKRGLYMVCMFGSLLAVMALALLFGEATADSGPTCQPPLQDRQRYGFVALSPSFSKKFDVPQLRAGWYAGHALTGSTPKGMDRALLIRTPTGFTLDPDILGPLVDDNPGAIWLISNEPDSIYQDSLLPEEYARIYQQLYAFIKNRDQTSQIAAGGIVQPTPLRLQYLDRVLTAYQSRYLQPMPVDLWHIHTAVLNEVSCDYDPDNCWGAEIPPGIESPFGAVRSVDDNDNMAMFRDQIWAFRQWMADRGYAGYPLIVTEYGILMPVMLGFDEARVNSFMSATFDFYRTATDQDLGDPTDGYRLVQRWAWYSLDDYPWNPITGVGFNGNLFNPDTELITGHGRHYATETDSLPPVSYVDLGVATWQALSAPPTSGPTDGITRLLRARVVNMGTSKAGGFWVTAKFQGPLNGTRHQEVAALPPSSSQWITFTLDGLQPGAYRVSIEVDPLNQVLESRECNNKASMKLIAPTDSAYLPQVAAHYAAMPISGGSLKTDRAAAPSTGNRPTSSTPGFREFEVPTANSYPAQIALDAQGRVWITERDGNKVARFDPETLAWQEYDIPTDNSRPWGLALDGDRDVWFAETAGNLIGHLELGETPDQYTFTEYTIPTLDSVPRDVAIGRDGTVWFTEQAGNRIGKLVPGQGVTAEYQVPTEDAGLSSVDIKGQFVYFTETSADQLGQFNITTGQFLEKRGPAGSAPQDLVTTGGGVWYSEMDGNRVVLFSPSTLSWTLELDVPTANSKPYGIALEGNVALWFTERKGNRLGRFTGTEPLVEYRLPSANSQPTGLVVDDAGCVWYTAPGVNRIGRLCLFELYLPQSFEE
jgi:virginiamycin B lyase